MKPIPEYNAEEYEAQRTKLNELAVKTAGLTRSQMFKDFSIRTGYAHYTFSGYLTPLLVKRLGRKPTADEIIMLVDSGFSHFGASCSINGNYFSGRVNTD